MIKSQTLIPLRSGAYKGRNAIGDYEICENLFPEMNPENTDPAVPVTHYPREGLRPLSTPANAGVGRGVFTLSNGACYAVCGNAIYSVSAGDFSQTLVGTIGTLVNPVYMIDNGTTALLVDGSINGYTITLSNNAFSVLSDPTGTFTGATRVDYADTYMAMNKIGSNGWIVTNPNTVAFNAFQQANASSSADPIVTLAFNIRQAWLLKSTHSEVWYLAGSTPFPYQEWPNIYVPYGCAAPYSLMRADISLFWISRNDQGQAIAVKTKGDAVVAVSTRALEFEWSGYKTVSDCIGGSFQQAGHTFVVFHFPSEDKTWAYDLASEQWHARIWIDTSGTKHRERVSYYASVGAPGSYPETIVGQDWQTGQLYALDPRYYTDNGNPIVCRRTFPHQLADLRLITQAAFVADFATGDLKGFGEVGSSDYEASYSPDYNNEYNRILKAYGIPAPALCMRYSKNGGRTWSEYRQKGLLTSGHYRSMMRYRGLGMGRDWVFELMWVYPGPCALNGAYADVIEHSA